ncbi:MAG TPA: histidine kinase dimerization/phospho-acceptor domain-containing protein [Planctomycetota bacterium]|nr:histidine kinase dimerization/phospho-acceptor domain-containing protein [Planctomycetota bacterium]
MVSKREVVDHALGEAAPLLERLRKALAHDLRTPLGTIGNYATILEYHDQAKPEEVRAFAGRIRTSVVRTASMLTCMTDALTLAMRKNAKRGAEPATILRSLLSELGIHGHFAANANEPVTCLELDPDLLTFCWRAFLGITAPSAPQGGLDLDFACSVEDASVSIDLLLGAQQREPDIECIDCSVYVLRHFDSPAQDACFAMSIAEHLVAARGGSLQIHGKAGAASRLRLRLPIWN